MLSQAIAPTTGECIEENILQNKQIKDTFKFISSVLEELIRNNGEVVYLGKLMVLKPEIVNKELVTNSNKPISVISFVARINKQVDKRKMHNLGYNKINNRLLLNGYLASEKVAVVKQETKYRVTEKAHDIGVVSDNGVDEKTSEISSHIFLSAQDQEFLLQNLEAILAA